jgi:hypothetical protein
MKYADNGTRIGDLKNILARIAEVACLFDTSGISIRAINRCVMARYSRGGLLMWQASILTYPARLALWSPHSSWDVRRVRVLTPCTWAEPSI